MKIHIVKKRTAACDELSRVELQPATSSGRVEYRIMIEIRTEIEIDAPVAEVWSILTDLSRYAEWNPFIRGISGELRQGAQLQVNLGPPGKRAMRFKPIVQEVEPEKAFRWLGRLLISGLFDGEHIFELETVGKNSTRFIQREKFNGILVGIFRKSLDTDIKSGFIAMNAALKQEVEKTAGQDKPPVPPE